MFGRRGPGLVRAAAATAVVAGTAGAVRHRQQERYARQDQEAYDQQMAQQAAYEQQTAAQAPAAPASGGEADYAAELQKLAELKAAGILTEEEFEAKKRQILGI
jgi:Short C-terminal domain